MLLLKENMNNPGEDVHVRKYNNKLAAPVICVHYLIWLSSMENLVKYTSLHAALWAILILTCWYAGPSGVCMSRKSFI